MLCPRRAPTGTTCAICHAHSHRHLFAVRPRGACYGTRWRHRSHPVWRICRLAFADQCDHVKHNSAKRWNLGSEHAASRGVACPPSTSDIRSRSRWRQVAPTPPNPSYASRRACENYRRGQPRWRRLVVVDAPSRARCRQATPDRSLLVHTYRTFWPSTQQFAILDRSCLQLVPRARAIPHDSRLASHRASKGLDV